MPTESSASTTRSSKRNLEVFTQVLVLIVCWWAAAAVVVIVIKSTLQPSSTQDALFPFPFALTSLCNGACGLIGMLISSVAGLFRGERSVPTLDRHERATLVAIGIIQGAEIGCNNKALEYLTVAARTMISSTNVLFMMATARLWGLEQVDGLRLVALVLLTCGSALQGLGGHRSHVGVVHHRQGGHGWFHTAFADTLDWSHLRGVVLMLVSMVLCCIRWCLLQATMQRAPKDSGLGKLTKLQLLTWIMPVTSFVCFMFACMFEQSALSPAWLSKELFFRVLTIAVLISTLTVAELGLVKLTSAVCLNVMSTLHQIPIVLAGVALFGDGVSLPGVSGFGLCLLGALVYARARSLNPHGGAAEKANQGAVAGPAGNQSFGNKDTELLSLVQTAEPPGDGDEGEPGPTIYGAEPGEEAASSPAARSPGSFGDGVSLHQASEPSAVAASASTQM